MKNNNNFFKEKPNERSVKLSLAVLKETAIGYMAIKNPYIAKLAERLDLYIETGYKEYMDPGDIRAVLTVKQKKIIDKPFLKKINMKTETKVTSKKMQEIELTDDDFGKRFIKFEDEGEVFTGKLVGQGKVQENDCFFVSNEDGEEFTLPTHVRLSQKIKKIFKLKGNGALGTNISIEYLGEVKVDGVVNKMRDYKVLYS